MPLMVANARKAKNSNQPNVAPDKVLAKILTIQLHPGAGLGGGVVLIEAASIAHENASAGKRISNCTKFWQPPVDGLHSTENKRDRIAIFILTSATGGVKTHSFFDKFPRFETAGKQAIPTRKRGNTRQVPGTDVGSPQCAHGASRH
jgi:hypothetical protein